MIDSGKIPAQYTESQLSQLVFNNRLDAGLTIFFMVVVVVLALYSLKTALAALKEDKPTAKETPYEPMPENPDEIVTRERGALTCVPGGASAYPAYILSSLSLWERAVRETNEK